MAISCRGNTNLRRGVNLDLTALNLFSRYYALYKDGYWSKRQNEDLQFLRNFKERITIGNPEKPTR